MGSTMPIKREGSENDFQYMLRILESYKAKEGSIEKDAYIQTLTHRINKLAENHKELSKIDDDSLLELWRLLETEEAKVKQSYTRRHDDQRPNRRKFGFYRLSQFRRNIHTPLYQLIERRAQARLHDKQRQIAIQTREAPMEDAHKRFLSRAHPSLVALHERIATTSGALSERDKEEIVKVAATVDSGAPLNHPIADAARALLKEQGGDDKMREGLTKLHTTMTTHLPSFIDKGDASPNNRLEN